MTHQFWIDDRYRGSHGIGRYATEVLARLDLPWTRLPVVGKPGRPLDAFQRVRIPEADTLYSPGYAGFASRRRQILTIHDLIHLQTAWPGRAKYLAYYASVVRPAVRRAGVVLTVSETSRRAIREWLGDDRVEIVNAGIGSSAAFTADGPRAASGRPYAMYVGNLRAHKNVDVILRALTKSDDTDLHMLLPASEGASARARVTELGLTSRVTVLHDLSDQELAAQYRGATATVMPSTLEGFGLPALESIQCATPVLFWRGCASVRETVGERGVAVDDAHDPAQWALALAAAGAMSAVEPPAPEEYSWARTAAVVAQTLREAADL